MFKRKTKADGIFDVLNVLLMITICFVTIYPIWFVLVNSFNDGMDAMQGGIYWLPRQFSLDNYKAVFTNTGILQALWITVAKTLIGTVVHVFFTAMVAYALSKKQLIGRKVYLALGLITLFFSGGLIPYYLLLRDLGLLNNFLVYIIPAAFSFYDLIIFTAFFREMPVSLEEAAMIDGANEFKIFLKVIIPLSMPVFATIALFHGVYQWNDYFTGIIFVNDSNLQPIQTYLFRIVAQSSGNQMSNLTATGVVKTTTSSSIKLATMVVTTAPIVCVYPFLQKYFVKGMMLGGVKG
jgi:putative aldouronate transport system permease protein